ncbi:DUF1818 family protein [Spirulina major CS-329]|uniref:DUF1818 family protein n=1 Tax=Spirulina TaxID=1154 RepID=UPI00232FC3D1|nr:MULTISPECIES: DUF1818 family protein [Spirulina]MDB9493355.1 DUF1818 family protein [Spirulina subsalsa CS-330]MDB9502167.1 DUF1818 family protein [Spirulina major CS-329]
MERILKTGEGWRLGWNPQAEDYGGLVGGEDWAVELTAAELQEFCRLLRQLGDAIASITPELMAEEHLTCAVESESLWLEADGLPHHYSLRLILNHGRRAEGNWPPSAIPGLLQATQMLNVF